MDPHLHTLHISIELVHSAETELQQLRFAQDGDNRTQLADLS